MSLVKFAVVCDVCGKRGEEYGGVLTCTGCGRDVNDCCAVSTDEEKREALCKDCDEHPEHDCRRCDCPRCADADRLCRDCEASEVDRAYDEWRDRDCERYHYQKENPE